MKLEEQWLTIHAYRKLAEEEKVLPWICSRDATIMVSTLGEGDNPVLWCYSCGDRVIPGLAMLERMRAQIEEFEEDQL